MSLAPFFAFEGYKVNELVGNPIMAEFNIELERQDEKPAICHKCGSVLGAIRGRHRLTVKDMPVFSCPVEIRLWRLKAHCPICKKARSERIDFISDESPHLTKHYTWWLGRLSEIAPISQAARFSEEAPQTIWRIDYARLKALKRRYKVPRVQRITVDEVYARKKKKDGESRDDLFFTVITDLDTRRVVWVSDSRKKEALIEFFELIGTEGCDEIKLVAADQHEEYAKAIRTYCPKAKLVWDKFHLVKNFIEEVNEARKQIIARLPSQKRRKMTSKVKKFLFIKKDSKRTEGERQSLAEALRDNEQLAKLEIIKERFLTIFNARNEYEAIRILKELTIWIKELGIDSLQKWAKRTREGWLTFRNYFQHRITSAVAEGTNNVIKSIKRRSFGFRNMDYFKLKIMQVCGLLNSKHYPDHHGLAIRGLKI